jgi:hypothetical protein
VSASAAAETPQSTETRGYLRIQTEAGRAESTSEHTGAEPSEYRRGQSTGGESTSESEYLRIQTGACRALRIQKGCVQSTEDLRRGRALRIQTEAGSRAETPQSTA